MTGAATVPVELVERMRSELRFESVVTAYGLTETHGTATVCRRTDPAVTIARTVGTALDGIELRIVDDDGVDVEPGRTGEVWHCRLQRRFRRVAAHRRYRARR